VSVNDEVVHGIPSAARALVNGDVVSIDMGVKMGGFYGDSAVTVPVGDVPRGVTSLLDVTRQSLEKAIEKVQVGGRMIVAHAEAKVTRNFIRLLVGDRVVVALMSKDVTRGRVVRLVRKV
jgi:methionyl aminopeptidase